MTPEYLDLADLVLAEVGTVLRQISPDDVARCRQAILAARRIFVAGKGRSGLLMRAHSMRLMHLGLTAHVVDDVTTPSIGASDLLLLASGSGGTPSVVQYAEKAHAIGAQIALLTANPESETAQLADVVVVIPAPSPKTTSIQTSAQPMASLFEQVLVLLLDIIIIQLMDELEQTSDQMYARHANLE
ncbi:MAG: 6-phospho-3-hexuloisomerase [Anaerolineae bacterium]|nr:6-phospho-3-hexuloisomerase [Anaerolineae bacterium]